MHSYTLQGFNHPTEAAGITFLPMGFVAANSPVPASCHKHLQNNVDDREWLGHQVELVPPVTCISGTCQDLLTGSPWCDGPLFLFAG